MPVVDASVIAWLLAGLACVLAARRLKAQAEENSRLRDTVGGLVRELLEDTGRDRARTAEALHDDAIQTLLVAKQNLVEVGDRDGGRAQRLVDEAISEVRAVIGDLYPESEPRPCLRTALEQSAEQAARLGEIDVDLEIGRMPRPHHEPLVLRAARELLINAAKHARASQVQVRLDAEGASTVLTVTDDGIGIGDGDSDAARQAGHLGLRSVADGVREAGGRLRIYRRNEGGTTCEVMLPESPG